MFSKILAGTITLACALSVATPAPAQFAPQAQQMETAVTFNIPVNLTQLSPDVERVRAVCIITSSALAPLGSGVFGSSPKPEQLPGDEALVVLGKVSVTLQVVFPIGTGWLKDPIGKEANYSCALLGYSRSLQAWQGFAATATAGAFVLNPVPEFQGTFTW